MTEIRESGWQGPIKESFGQKVVNGVNNSILAWWEKAGPKPIEDHFVQAHQRIVDSMPDDDSRKEAFRLMADNWKKTGVLIGAMATGFDFSLAAVVALLGFKKSRDIYDDTRDLAKSVAGRIDEVSLNRFGNYTDYKNKIGNLIDYHFKYNPHTFVRGDSANNALYLAIEEKNSRKRAITGRLISIIPLGTAVASYAGMGPAHIAGALTARVAEGVTKQTFKAKKK